MFELIHINQLKIFTLFPTSFNNINMSEEMRYHVGMLLKLKLI